MYDLVIKNGRVIDPESRFDKVTNLGIISGKIQLISDEEILGEKEFDASSLVVAPGAIDLHSHGQDKENYRIQANDGVTTALGLEIGVADITGWYSEREGKSLINFGASIGHIPVRMQVMRDPGGMLPLAEGAYKEASQEEINQMKNLMREGFENGALAMGFGLAYTPMATRWEAIEMFRIASNYGASCHVHMRGMGHKEPLNSIEGLSELIAASATSGAPLHLVHINSSGQKAVESLLQMIEESRSNGIDVTTECYPYAAGMTLISSAILDEGWKEKLDIGYENLEWAETGERLTERTFAEYREMDGMVIMHSMQQDLVDMAVMSPLTAIASDGYINKGKGHPRTAGCYSKVLGDYVRRSNGLSLIEALRKTSLMPAERLESLAPAFKNKGRIKIGADADIIVFDKDKLSDRSTYQNPTLPPEGMKYVFVNGVGVIINGEPQVNQMPGKGIRSN